MKVRLPHLFRTSAAARAERPTEDERTMDVVGLLLVELLAVRIRALSRQGLHDWLNAVALCLVCTPPADRAVWLSTWKARLVMVWPAMDQGGTMARDLNALIQRAAAEWQHWKQRHAPEAKA